MKHAPTDRSALTSFPFFLYLLKILRQNFVFSVLWTLLAWGSPPWLHAASAVIGNADLQQATPTAPWANNVIELRNDWSGP